MSEYTRADKLRGLQGMINFLEVNTEVELPDVNFPIYFFGDNDKTRESAKKIAHAFGTFKKSENDSYLTLTKEFGEGVQLRAVFTRAGVCTKRVVGTRKVMKDIYPAHVTPAQVEVEEDIVEWDCPSLLRDDDSGEEVEASTEAASDDEIQF